MNELDGDALDGGVLGLQRAAQGRVDPEGRLVDADVLHVGVGGEGLEGAHADAAFVVSGDDQCAKPKTPTALHYFAGAVNENYFLGQLVSFGIGHHGWRATFARASATIAATSTGSARATSAATAATTTIAATTSTRATVILRRWRGGVCCQCCRGCGSRFSWGCSWCGGGDWCCCFLCHVDDRLIQVKLFAGLGFFCFRNRLGHFSLLGLLGLLGLFGLFFFFGFLFLFLLLRLFGLLFLGGFCGFGGFLF